MDSVIQAFTEDHVIRLTGLSRSQLRAWDRIGFFKPDYAAEDRHQPYSRILGLPYWKTYGRLQLKQPRPAPARHRIHQRRRLAPAIS